MFVLVVSVRPYLLTKCMMRSFATDALHRGSLNGKKCIITGASRGIGAEVARRFANEGAMCILIGRNGGLLEGLKAELKWAGSIEAEDSERHKVIVGDVRQQEFWKRLRGEVRFPEPPG